MFIFAKKSQIMDEKCRQILATSRCTKGFRTTQLPAVRFSSDKKAAAAASAGYVSKAKANRNVEDDAEQSDKGKIELTKSYLLGDIILASSGKRPQKNEIRMEYRTSLHHKRADMVRPCILGKELQKQIASVLNVRTKAICARVSAANGNRAQTVSAYTQRIETAFDDRMAIEGGQSSSEEQGRRRVDCVGASERLGRRHVARGDGTCMKREEEKGRESGRVPLAQRFVNGSDSIPSNSSSGISDERVVQPRSQRVNNPLLVEFKPSVKSKEKAGKQGKRAEARLERVHD
ncbi:hypothetical protein C8R45DRAFT_946517 [Mycena sanguinolenta]|nr:hypothetical protein C8R45DRAFT_946517 [Mycena sanguinolenta]